MKLIWLERASHALEEHYDFLARVSPRAAANLYNDILDVAENLATLPALTSIELLLEGEPEMFRSIVVHRRYKIIYFVEDETLKIADVWDTRRDPAKLRERTLRRLS
jgi:plasmid stabilization system protein ParE